MIRILVIEDEPRICARAQHRLRGADIESTCDSVASQSALQEALARRPDIVLLDASAKSVGMEAMLALVNAGADATPVLVVGNEEDDPAVAQLIARASTEAPRLRNDLGDLPDTLRATLERRGVRIRRDSDRARSSPAKLEASGVAEHLIARRAALDNSLPHKDTSPLAVILRRSPPLPAALVMINERATRERYSKLLRNANIEIEEASDSASALAALDARVHALLFTDQTDLVREARQLYAGSATHIVFVNQGEEGNSSEVALRAGANDCLSSEARGELFWAHLTTARRIVTLASSLQLALSDNRILSTIDELTRCGSRRFFEQQFPREVERAVRFGRPIALVMADIDRFKAVNDGYGHPVGDEVLREFGERLTRDLRYRQDWVARVGGEEFALVLPDTPAKDARAIAKRLCRRVGSKPIDTAAGRLVVTASFGVCARTAQRQSVGALAAEMIQSADRALYESKRRGRNQVTEATERQGAEPLG